MKTWYNHPCTFLTKNTLNALGDSKYMVLINQMTRFAKINIQRAPSQVNTGNPSVCYLVTNSELYKKIMLTPDDSKITIEKVYNDFIIVNANGYKGLSFRKPQLGYTPFDFVNNDGTLSYIHVGHEIYKIT